jgi:hypothetical protein
MLGVHRSGDEALFGKSRRHEYALANGHSLATAIVAKACERDCDATEYQSMSRKIFRGAPYLGSAELS